MSINVTDRLVRGEFTFPKTLEQVEAITMGLVAKTATVVMRPSYRKFQSGPRGPVQHKHPSG